MHIRVRRAARGLRAAALAIALILVSARAGSAADSTLFRLFLVDGTALVSYGEFARVADRVILSIPVGGDAQSPNLQLVSIPEASVDWDRTDRYTNAVRARKYAETRGDVDFLLLSGRVAEALNQIALTKDPARQLSMALEARGNLARWPADNFGYRAEEVSQLTGMLDEVISELRIAAGQSRFDVSLVANTLPPPPVDLLPPPDFRQSMQQALAAAAATQEPAERLSLLQAISSALQPARRESWAASLYARATADLAAEQRIERSYAELSSSTIASATARVARGDVTGLQGLVRRVLDADDRLGRRRPRETAALLAVLDLRLDEARRLRLARDAWALRAEAFKAYRTEAAFSFDELRQSKRALEAIRELAGPSPITLPRLEQRLDVGARHLRLVQVPPELETAHGLFAAAFDMARRAVSTRRNAVISKDMKLAWDASSAAAGALMLIDRALTELDRLVPAAPLR